MANNKRVAKTFSTIKTIADRDDSQIANDLQNQQLNSQSLAIAIIEEPIVEEPIIDASNNCHPEFIEGLTRGLYQNKYFGEPERLFEKLVNGQLKYFETTLVAQVGTKIRETQKRTMSTIQKQLIRDTVKSELKTHLMELISKM